MADTIWVDPSTGTKYIRRGYCNFCGQCCGDEVEKCEFLRFKDESKGFVAHNTYCLLFVEGKPTPEICNFKDFPTEPAQCKNPACSFYFEELKA